MRDASTSMPRAAAEGASPRCARERDPVQKSSGAPGARWKAPRFEVIPLDCEVSAYAPAGDEPLF